MKAAFKVWQNFEEVCEGTKHQFQVLTDHRNLEYLHTKRLNSKTGKMGPIIYTLPFHHHLPSWFQERQSRHSVTTAWILTQLQNDEPIISPTLILSPVQWDIMTKITNAQNSDPPPLNCSPGKSYVPLFLCSPLCFWWPTMQADTITHVQNFVS